MATELEAIYVDLAKTWQYSYGELTSADKSLILAVFNYLHFNPDAPAGTARFKYENFAQVLYTASKLADDIPEARHDYPNIVKLTIDGIAEKAKRLSSEEADGN